MSAEKKLSNLTVVRFVDEYDSGQFRQFIFWSNQPGTVMLVTQGQPHDTNRVSSLQMSPWLNSSPAQIDSEVQPLFGESDIGRGSQICQFGNRRI
jgi:hypothetical protein